MLGLSVEDRQHLAVIGGVDYSMVCSTFQPNPYSVYADSNTWPVEDKKAPLTSCFVPRPDPVTFQPGYHWGVDIGGLEGSPVLAAMDSKITLAAPSGNYGNLIIIQASDGTLTGYGHLNDFALPANPPVSRGQVIGHVGNTGKLTGPHLHFEIRPHGRNPVNPRCSFTAKAGVMPAQRAPIRAGPAAGLPKLLAVSAARARWPRKNCRPRHRQACYERARVLHR